MAIRLISPEPRVVIAAVPEVVAQVIEIPVVEEIVVSEVAVAPVEEVVEPVIEVIEDATS